MKRYLWVVEHYKDGEWVASRLCYEAREEARNAAKDANDWGNKTRIRKYIPDNKCS